MSESHLAETHLAETRVSDKRVSDALERVYESGQNLLLTRIDLLVAELRGLARDALLSLAGAGVALVGISWLSYALFRQLDLHLSAAGAAGATGLVALLASGALLLCARRGDDTEGASS